MQKLATRKLTGNDDISKALTKEYRKMSSDMPLSELSRILEKKIFVFVDSKYIVSNYDLLNFMQDKIWDVLKIILNHLLDDEFIC